MAHLLIWIFERLAKLPMNKLYRIADIMFYVLTHATILPIHRKVRKRLKEFFPEYDAAKLSEIERLHLKCLCDNVVEVMALYRFSEEELRDAVVYKNIEVLDKIFGRNRFVVCFSGHFAGFEFLAGYPILRNEYGMFSYYNMSIKNKTIDSWVRKRRERFGVVCIPIQYPMRHIIKCKHKMDAGKSEKLGYVLGSLADFQPCKGAATGVVTFFNKDEDVLVGTERMGNILEAEFVYANITRPQRGKYEVEFIPLDTSYIEHSFPYTQAFFSELEKNIRQQPEIWMMWGVK
ncbi:MAG: hypothetical protein IKU93_00995 [Alistipes sp.]|nr:hypothetical protein [Alistipes sp.]